MAVTLKNISEICKVDISTVSRALRNDMRVKKETREYIQTKAAELGYSPNLAARNLVSGKTLNLWMIISELSNPVEQEPAQFLSKSLHDKGYELLITLYHTDAKKFNHLLAQLSKHVADGAFIIPSMEYSAPAYLPLLQNNFPLVFIDRQPTFTNCTTVTTANRNATTKLLQKSVKAGADHFIVMTDSSNSAADARTESAVKFLSENKLEFSFADIETAPPANFMEHKLALLCPSGINAGKYAEKFIKPNSPPLLISASFDSAPGNTAIFDNIFVGIQNFEIIAENAADLMLEKINGENITKTVEIPLKKLMRLK